MKIAVVGSTGILGCAFIPLLLEQGYAVRALARSTKKAQTLLPQGVEIVECDLLSPDVDEHMSSMLDGCETVVHIATAIPRDFTGPNAWDANTRLRTTVVKTLLKASLEVGVRRYVQQSITMAYPDYGEDWITEDALLDPLIKPVDEASHINELTTGSDTERRHIDAGNRAVDVAALRLDDCSLSTSEPTIDLGAS